MKYLLVVFYPRVADGIRMASISDGVFTFNSSAYGIFLFLFPRVSILIGSTSNVVADSSSPGNMKDFVTTCTNPFLRFPHSEPAEWIRIRSCDPCTLTR